MDEQKKSFYVYESPTSLNHQHCSRNLGKLLKQYKVINCLFICIVSIAMSSFWYEVVSSTSIIVRTLGTAFEDCRGHQSPKRLFHQNFSETPSLEACTFGNFRTGTWNFNISYNSAGCMFYLDRLVNYLCCKYVERQLLLHNNIIHVSNILKQ